MENCVFCKIINRQLPSYIIDEEDEIIVFISLEGHPMIVTIDHIPDIHTLDEDNAVRIMKKSLKIARATKDALGCDGIKIVQSNGAAAGQIIFHYHMHIYPKWEDGRQIGTSDEVKQQTLEKIKKALE